MVSNECDGGEFCAMANERGEEIGDPNKRRSRI
jgi:hypothetical protein